MVMFVVVFLWFSKVSRVLIDFCCDFCCFSCFFKGF